MYRYCTTASGCRSHECDGPSVHWSGYQQKLRSEREPKAVMAPCTVTRPEALVLTRTRRCEQCFKASCALRIFRRRLIR